MPATDRVCVLGIDAAEPHLVERWCGEGALPALDRLRRAGLWIPLRQNGAYPSGSVWPTVCTGTHPGQHGIVYPVGIVPGTLTLQSSVPAAYPEPPLWSRLAKAGARSIVVDVPFAPLSRDAETVQIVDWATYERPRPAQSWPHRTLPELVRETGEYPVQRDLGRDPAASEAERWRDHAALLAGVGVKGAALRWLVRHRPWDFFLAVFGEAHAAGHYFWDVKRRAGGRATGDPLRDVYGAIDAEIGRFLDALDLTRTTLIVLSGHGMGRNGGGWHLVEPLLRSMGLLVPAASAGSVLGRVRGACPDWLRRSVSRWLPPAVRTSMSEYWLLGGIDPRRTRAFALPSDQLGFVRINLVGREPGGTVDSGRPYADLCRTLDDTLRGLVDAETGRPVVRDIYHADTTFPGPARAQLPDLLVSWSEETFLDAVRRRDGVRIVRRSPDPRSGNHRPDGFAIVCSPGLPRGRAAAGHLLDVAPTVLGCFGLDPTASMTGRSWLPSPLNLVRPA
jgi:predicted AlkP superfamily phosphohydrolase/phosphomutase